MDRLWKLEARISTYEQCISYIIKLDDDARWSEYAGKCPELEPDLTEGSEDYLNDFPECWFTPEKERVTLPSALAPGEVARLLMEGVAKVEAGLRKGQINDSLDGLRLALGEKSLCFRMDVRNANSQRTTQRAWDNIHKFDTEARKHRNIYNICRDALRRLDIDPEYLETLRDITEDDMKMAGDITEEHRVGQRSDTLAWFWRHGANREGDDMSGPHMHECEWYPLYAFQSNLWEWAIASHGRVLGPLGADKFYINYCLRHIVSHN